ncbi:hypothetical protein EDB87DRAFT_1764545 [Lactarius vividus]|nr:hypothetical protein EDB87DRAFT_1764545 [Lactarius vividus]
MQHSNLAPSRAHAARTRIFVDAPPLPAPARAVKMLSTGAHPIISQDLASDIQQFRKIPVGQVMVWQAQPAHYISAESLPTAAQGCVGVFRAVHRLMGDSESGATIGSNTPRLEEARWLLGEGLMDGKLRDGMTNNPNAYVAFRVLLNFEPYLYVFLSQDMRVDVLAKHCLKTSRSCCGEWPLSLAEIETASRAPIVLPFLASGVLALGATKSEGILRVPGDCVDDPHMPASLFKVWLHRLPGPLVPTCCAGGVERLPIADRRVVLFVKSLLQLLLVDELVLAATKMTNADLLRCGSDSMAIVFNDA